MNGADISQTASDRVLTRRDWLALGALLALTAILLGRYLFARPAPLIYPESDLGTDFPREVWPLTRFVVDAVRGTGKLPLWRPYLLSGAPLIGHPVAPVLYPPNWLALILPLPLALNVVAALHLWWAGAGTYVHLRLQTRTRIEAAFLGALLFAHAPKWIAHLSGGHWPMIAAIAWWPWAWLGFSRYWKTGGLRWAVLLGVALAAQALNDGRHLALSVLWLGACTLGFVRRGAVLDWLRRAVVGWGTALGLTAALAAGQLAPLLELLPYTNRTALGLSEAGFGSLPPALLLGMLFPAQFKFPEWFIFPGVGALLLTLLGWAAGWSRRERWWVVGALAGGVMSLGTYTPAYRALYRFLPGFSFLRVPARWWLFTLFGLALLAAYGAESWLEGATRRGRRLPVALVGLGMLYLPAAGVKLAVPPLLPFEILPSAAAFVALAALTPGAPSRLKGAAMAAIVLADVWWAAGNLIRPQPEAALVAPDAVADYLQSSLRDGERVMAPYGGLSEPALVALNLRAADGYDPFQLTAYAELVKRASGCNFAGYAVAVPPTRASPEAVRACPDFEPDIDLLALLNVRYVVLSAPTHIPGSTLAVADTGSQRYVYELTPGLGAAFGVSEGELVSEADCLDRLVAVDPARTALVESPLPFEEGSPPVVLSAEDMVNGQRFTVRADGPGLLVRSETWAPGWRASVDGQAADVLRVDCALQGVWLEAGAQHVRFDYLPRSYAVGRWVSLGAALGLATWAGFLILRARRVA